MRGRCAAPVLAGFLALAAAAPAAAQVQRLDPVPWFAIADTAASAVVFGADRFWDDGTGWAVDRVNLAVVARLGRRGAWFLRASALRFDAADRPVPRRWPHVMGPDAGDGWPGSGSPSGIGQPEAGLIVPTRLPLVGPVHAALAVGLPVGSDDLYPFSAASLPLRLDLRRTWAASARPAWRAAVQAGGETTFDSSREDLAEEAFPDGWRLGAAVAWQPEPWRQVCATYEERRLAGHVSRRASLEAWWPLGAGHALGLVAARELAHTRDRPATQEVSLRWRFAGLPAAQQGESR